MMAISLLLASDGLALSSLLLLLLLLLRCSSRLRVQQLFRKLHKRGSVFALLEVFRVGSAVLEGLSEQLGLG
jgi:hypothetical protein